MTYYIYKATCKSNGKVYIGCTRKIGSRIGQHIRASLKDNPLFHKAIVDQGVCDFTWEIIDIAEYADDAFNKERYYIKLFNSFYPNGYNATTGGSGAPGVSDRRVVCLNLDGSYVKTYESANSTERDGLSPSYVLLVCKGMRRSSKNHVFMFEDDYMKNGPRVYEKPTSPFKKSVVQCDSDGNKISEFDSVTEAAEKTDTPRTAISACLIGNVKHANGFIWVYADEYPIKDIYKYKRRTKGVKVAQIDKNTGNVIATYDSISEAGAALGVSYKNIQKILGMPDRTAYGFKWQKVSQ